jgi:ATP-binding cassette subfamily B (MDR/TAP) protein 1
MAVIGAGDGAKQHSDTSSNTSNHDVIAADQEKAALGQAPFPNTVVEQPAPLVRLDSKPPKSKKEKEQVKKDADEGDDDAFAHLPEHEAEILRRQLATPPVKVTYFRLYRYATRTDKIIIAVSAIAAIIAGAVLPLMTVVFGQLTGSIGNFSTGNSADLSSFSDTVNRLTIYYIYLAIGEFVTVYIATVGFIYAGEHMSAKIREEYLGGILRQNIAYFDARGAGEITTRITADTNLVQDGISEKVGLTLTALATFITAYIIGFVKYWKLTLILTSTIVAIVVTMGSLGKLIVKYQKRSLAAYAEGGTVAEEVLSSIRNAVAFGTQDKLATQYAKHLTEAEKSGFKMKGENPPQIQSQIYQQKRSPNEPLGSCRLSRVHSLSGMIGSDACSSVGYHHMWLDIPVRTRARECTLSVVYPAMLCAQASGNTTNDPASQ